LEAVLQALLSIVRLVNLSLLGDKGVSSENFLGEACSRDHALKTEGDIVHG
jgi:hypothetical protein